MQTTERWFTHEAPEGSGQGGHDGGRPRRVVHQRQFPEAAAVVVATHQLLGALHVDKNAEGPPEEGKKRKDKDRDTRVEERRDDSGRPRVSPVRGLGIRAHLG